MMTTRQVSVAVVILTIAAWAYSLALYPGLPDRIPIHWNVHGEIDGWGSRPMGAFLMPGIIAALGLMLFALPWVSPRNFKVDSFRKTFDYVIFVMTVLMAYLHVIMLQAALHPQLDLGRALVAGICVVLALVGNVLGKVRRNFWVGIRTPWTLANDTVWIATHRLAARLFLPGCLLLALAAWLGAPLAWCFVALMVLMLVPAVHSLVLYKRLEREGRL